MDIPAVFCIRTRIFASTERSAASETDFGASVFNTLLFGFNGSQFHYMTGRAQWNTVTINSDAILINRWSSTFSIKINECGNTIEFTVIVIRHRIMAESRRSFFTTASGSICFIENQLYKIHESHA